MQLKSLHELFILQIKDLYSAENQLLKALPRMAKKTQTTALKDAFNKHLEQTQEHVNRLDEIADNLEFNPKGHVCQAMKGLILEGTEIIKSKGNSDILDAGLIAAAQRVEHYEISAYGTALAYARLMKHNTESGLLKKTLDEESETNELLSKIAETEVNKNAFEANRRMESDEE
jgi:ferritin-like metal-binding protein YciE